MFFSWSSARRRPTKHYLADFGCPGFAVITATGTTTTVTADVITATVTATTVTAAVITATATATNVTAATTTTDNTVTAAVK